jgi:SdrD B-like domain/PKD domain
MPASALSAWTRRFLRKATPPILRPQRRANMPALGVVEALEGRALLAAIGSENFLVIADTATAPFITAEYTRSGQFVQVFASQRPGGWPSGEVARDVAVTADGRLHVFNGSVAPYLSTLDPVAGTWTHTPFAGWSTEGTPAFGGLGAIGHYVFASDTHTSSDSVGGIVRFDTITREAVRFGSVEVRDLSIGLDGLIYTLDKADSRVVRGWDPTAMAQVKQVTLSSFPDLTGIAADAAGNVFVTQWGGAVIKFGPNSTVPLTREVVTGNLTDIEIATDGTVIVGTLDGDVLVMDATLTAPLRISRGGTTAYVAFGRPQVLPPEPGGISGTAFADSNGNGFRDAFERGLDGVTLYLDLDRDGNLDTGEPTTVSAGDGSYGFTVAPGEYVVRQIAPTGYQQTAPGSANDFYYATNRGATNAQAELLRVDAATGAVTVVGRTDGVVIHGLVRTNDGRLFGFNGFNSGNDTFYSIDPATGQTTLLGSVGADLAWGLAYDAATDTIFGIGRLPGSNFNRLGTFDRLTGAFTPIPGGNGVSATTLNATSGLAFDPVRRSVIVYEHGDGQTWEFSLDGTGTFLRTNTAGVGLNLTHDGARFVMRRDFGAAAGTLLEFNPFTGTMVAIGSFASTPVESLEFVKAHTLSRVIRVAPGATAKRLDFGSRSLTNEIRGTVWDDLDADGVRDAGEPGLGGVTVYLDLDGNGQYGNGFPVTTPVDPDTFPNLTVLENAVSGVKLTALGPPGGILDTVKSLPFGPLGQVFGHREEVGGEAILWGIGWATLRADFATPVDSVAVDIAGYFANRTAVVQAYNSAGNKLADVRLPVASNQTRRIFVTGPGIAYVLVTSSDGSIVIDRLSFDTPVPEPATISAADGSYSFTGLEPGTYFVNTVRPRGWGRTSFGNDRDVLWGTAYVPDGSGAMKLVTIHPENGHITWIGDPLPLRLYGLVRTNSGELYATSFVDDRLYAVDPATGRVTLIGPTGWSITGGLAYDPLSDTIYTIGLENTGSGTFARLLQLDRQTGAATAIGPGLPAFPGSTNGPTGISALAFDVVTGRVIAFDNADSETYAFDRAGNGTLLSTAPSGLHTWALTAGRDWGTFLVQPLDPSFGDRVLSGFDPATGLFVDRTITLSEAVRFEALDRNYDAFRYVVRADGIISDVNFGIYDADWGPVAHSGGPYTIAEGDSLTLDGSRSSDEDDDPLTYEWDLKTDGTIDATGVAPTLTWQQLVAAGVNENGTYSVWVRVRDPRGNSSTWSTTLTVLNAAPVVTSLTLDQAVIAEGGTTIVNGTWTDAGVLDTHVVTIDWGDGTSTVIDPAAGGAFSRSHVYADVTAGAPLQYTIRVTVRDDDAGSVSDTRTLNVTRPAPAVTRVQFGYGNGLWADAADLAGRTSPWKVTKIAVVFDHDVFVDIADLTVTGVSGVLAFSAFSYNAASRTAVWTLASEVQRDRLTIVLDGDDASSDGNEGVRASGGYLAGGDQARNLDVLFGDVSGDGQVNLTDILLMRIRNGSTDRWADLNGDGVVNLSDMLLVRIANGTHLP